jgi:hypothetical protein
VSAGYDKSYVLYDLANAAVLTQVYGDAGKYSLDFYSKQADGANDLKQSLLRSRFTLTAIYWQQGAPMAQ